jgi:hypothetical protein
MTVEWAMRRLRELRTEYAGGESQLLQLEHHRVQVQDSMLRVAGAIQVLEEMVAASGTFDPEVEPAAASAS